jgi:hypothetical protein
LTDLIANAGEEPMLSLLLPEDQMRARMFDAFLNGIVQEVVR